jgi:SpoVK/Ycf46/Vps4 family AAA+-type ATPase
MLFKPAGVNMQKRKISASPASSQTLDRLVKRITPNAALNELPITGSPKRIMQEITRTIKAQPSLAPAKSKLVLFSGSRAKTKTMAAEVIASVLGVDLYRIDLKQVVNKYIGETEKNLAKLFDRAKRASSVLLFDEADALFGKRTDARAAHDRYANLETGYLLERIETYKGVVILSTNLISNMDKAIHRRADWVVEFSK